MARREPIAPDELAICKRLREFRLSTKIPRAAFAIAVGISSDRLSEHENGRVPVRYAVFKAIHRQFYVNPGWLVKGTGPTAFESPLDLSKTEERCDDRALLSWCYRQALGQEVTSRQFDRFFAMFGRDGLARRVEEYVSTVEAAELYGMVTEDELEKVIARLSNLLEKLRSQRTDKAEPST